MLSNFILFFLSYFVILTSILGYGLLFASTFAKQKKYNFGYIGLLGIFFLILYSYFSNIFFAHSELHNLLFLIIGLISFLIVLKKKFQTIKNEFFFTIIIFLILFISSLIFKNHDDFPYYHFPYTFYLTQQSFFMGIGQFNHGFRTPSSIFYLNSLFYLPLLKYYLFNFSAIYILGFANIIFLKKIHNFFIFYNFKKNLNNKINYLTFLNLFLFAFVNIFFYRIGEHGTDRSAQILICILVVLILEYFYFLNFKKIDLMFIYILLGLIISLKAFYILYLIILLPLFIFILEKKKNFFLSLQYFIKNKNFIIFLLMLFFVIGTYFINTGCLIYPLSITCFDNFSWALPASEAQRMNNWYELWSKAGANPNFRVSNPEEYITNFNWVSNWIDSYFFNKVSDFIFGLLFTILIFLLSFIRLKNRRIKLNLNKYTYFTFFILVILFIEWFYNHPALRYGGYCLIAIILFIPTSIYLSTFMIEMKKFTNLVFILILITALISVGRNVARIKKEIQVYNYMPIKGTFYKIDDHYFRIQKNMDTILKEKKNKKLLGKIIFSVNK